jgi:hypothetical protein
MNLNVADNCCMNMQLTWKHSVLPYIFNALVLPESGIQTVKERLNTHWKQFLRVVFDKLSDFHE